MKTIDYKKTVLKDKNLIPKEKEVIYEVDNICKNNKNDNIKKNGKEVKQIETIIIDSNSDFPNKRKVVI